jgi:N utilization substance protein A
MADNQLLTMVNYIERENGVDREIVLVAIEQAIQQAARRNPGVTNDLRVVIDRKTITLHVYDTMVVSDEDTGTGFISVARAQRLDPSKKEGDTIEIELPASRLGRIAAQTSRQMIMQKLREAIRSNTFNDFKGRIGEIVSGTVTGLNRRDLYVMVGKTEMVLPAKERIPTEEYSVGDTVRAIVHHVKQDATGPAVTLSRASGEFVRALFRLEVSEISDGVVELVSVARDPGYRSKIAVRTMDEKVDPVGACVGMRGARVKNVVNELHGEKIDIIQWSPDLYAFARAALAPANVLDLWEEDYTDKDGRPRRRLNAIITPEQYSLTIGRRGLNVRLTSQLLGIDVNVTKSEPEPSAEDQYHAAVDALASVPGIGEENAQKLIDAGYHSVDGILDPANDFRNAAEFDPEFVEAVWGAALAWKADHPDEENAE